MAFMIPVGRRDLGVLMGGKNQQSNGVGGKNLRSSSQVIVIIIVFSNSYRIAGLLRTNHVQCDTASISRFPMSADVR